MVKDFLISFADNFKEKTTNPFLGTYLVVWLIRNWDLIYSLFNFNSNSKRGDKIAFIKNYYSEISFVENLLINILWSFGLLILTYLLVNLSRVIVNLSEKQLTPWIYKITDSNSIVLKEEYDRIRSDRDELQDRLDKERDSKSKLDARIKALESEMSEVLKGENEKIPEIPDTHKSYEEEEKRINSFINRINSKSSSDEFLKLCLQIQRGEAIENEVKSIDYFITLGLFVYKSTPSSYNKNYAITEDGKKVLNKLTLEA